MVSNLLIKLILKWSCHQIYDDLTACMIKVISNIIGALIVYDITDLESWSKVSKWVKELQMYLPQDTPIIITGNKCDIPNRQIPLDEAER